jgi:hypothetical protein
MPTFFEIVGRAAEPVYQEVTEALFCPGKIIGRVERAKNFILANLSVERPYQLVKPFVANR